MSGATETGRDIAAALRAEWRMIASVSLRRRPEGDGFAASLRLDPIVLKGSLEQQGYPRTHDTATKLEERRRAALAQCVERVNRRLSPGEQIRTFSIYG